MDKSEDKPTKREFYREQIRKGGKCSFCPPHDGENRTRRKKPDKGKNPRRGK